MARLTALTVACVTAAAACGSDDRSSPPDTSTTTSAAPRSTAPVDTIVPEPSTPISTSPTPTTIEPVEVACGDGPTGQSRDLVTRQELVFDGTVTATRLERNPEGAYRTTFLDDGEEDPGAPPPDEADLVSENAGPLWPWTTFTVHAWFTNDWGEEITIWTAGLDLAAGDRLLIAGQAFLTAVPENVEHSGMAVVCATAVHSPDLESQWHDWFGGSVEPGGNQPEGEPDPEAVEAIEAGRARWERRRPDVYSAVLYATGDGPDDAPCPVEGSVRVVVERGVVTSAVNEFRGCRIDPAVSDVPTIDDLFDEAVTASGAKDHGYSISPRWGFPIGYSGYDRAVEIGGGVSWFRPESSITLVHNELTSELDAQRAAWDRNGPANYTFVLQRQCFCGDTDPFIVTVVDGRRHSITDRDGRSVRADLLDYLPGSIDELFDKIDPVKSGSDMVVATFDDALGYPLYVYDDSISEAVDDEVTWIVRTLTPSG